MSNEKITIVVITTYGDFSNEYDKTAKLQTVLEDTLSHFNLDVSPTHGLIIQGDLENELKLIRPIVSYNIETGTVLELVDIGAAV